MAHRVGERFQESRRYRLQIYFISAVCLLFVTLNSARWVYSQTSAKRHANVFREVGTWLSQHAPERDRLIATSPFTAIYSHDVYFHPWDTPTFDDVYQFARDKSCRFLIVDNYDMHKKNFMMEPALLEADTTGRVKLLKQWERGQFNGVNNIDVRVYEFVFPEQP